MHLQITTPFQLLSSATLTAVLPATLLMATVGCANPHSSESDYRTQANAIATADPTDTFDPKACDADLLPDQGPNAKFENASSHNVVQSAYFEKKYNRGYLEAVLDASAATTIEFIKSLGITVVKAPDLKSGLCKTYFPLPVMEGVALQRWTRILGGGDGVLQGIYFDACSSTPDHPCLEHAVLAPTIVVRETGDRWASIHEMMHYNFSRTRKEDLSRTSPIQMKADLKLALDAIKFSMRAYQVNPNEKDLRELLRQVNVIFGFLRDELAVTTWEDIAIEGTLIDELSSGHLTHVLHRSASDTAWYMASARALGLKRCKPMLDILRVVKYESQKHGWKDMPALADATQAQATALETESMELVKDAYVKMANLQHETIDPIWPDSPELRSVSIVVGALDPHLSALDRSSFQLNQIEGTLTQVARDFTPKATSLPARAR